MSAHIAICSHGASSTAALVLATKLRGMRESVDLHYSGKLDRQFARARRSNPSTILTIREDMTCRLWFRWKPAVEASLPDATAYLCWMADDADVLPDPPDYLLADAPAVEEWRGEYRRKDPVCPPNS